MTAPTSAPSATSARSTSAPSPTCS
jgi:hypothetical protein